MGGPTLELFRFGFYLFFPVAALLHYGNPDWYTQHVVPYREKMLPPEERMNKSLPTDSSSLQRELARIKAEKLAKRAQRQEEAMLSEASDGSPPTPRHLV